MDGSVEVDRDGRRQLLRRVAVSSWLVGWLGTVQRVMLPGMLIHQLNVLLPSGDERHFDLADDQIKEGKDLLPFLQTDGGGIALSVHIRGDATSVVLNPKLIVAAWVTTEVMPS